jgi:hypothetical protein
MVKAQPYDETQIRQIVRTLPISELSRARINIEALTRLFSEMRVWSDDLMSHEEDIRITDIMLAHRLVDVIYANRNLFESDELNRHFISSELQQHFRLIISPVGHTPWIRKQLSNAFILMYQRLFSDRERNLMAYSFQNILDYLKIQQTYRQGFLAWERISPHSSSFRRAIWQRIYSTQFYSVPPEHGTLESQRVLKLLVFGELLIKGNSPPSRCDVF